MKMHELLRVNELVAQYTIKTGLIAMLNGRIEMCERVKAGVEHITIGTTRITVDWRLAVDLLELIKSANNSDTVKIAEELAALGVEI